MPIIKNACRGRRTAMTFSTKKEIKMRNDKMTAVVPIIDALLSRMSLLGRCSSDGVFICNADLDKLDVVRDCDSGQFGVVTSISRYAYKNQQPTMYSVHFMDDEFFSIVSDGEDRVVRTILDAEVEQARQALMCTLTSVFDTGVKCN